jgi:hypothetical protein
MKRLFGLAALSVLLWGGGVQAQVQDSPSATTQDDDDAEEYYYEVLFATALINENCKSVLEATYYEGFKVLLRVHYGELGATDEQVLQEEADAVKYADYICSDKAACWRSATDLAATATPEEGRQACMSQLIESFHTLEDFLTPENES